MMLDLQLELRRLDVKGVDWEKLALGRGKSSCKNCLFGRATELWVVCLRNHMDCSHAHVCEAWKGKHRAVRV